VKIVDLKTLEYMESRTKKAREIVTRIEKLKVQMGDIKRSRGCMDLYTPTKTIRIEASYQDRAEDNYITLAAAAIYNAFIDVTTAEIKRLEKELKEL
jgi:hypothetical protein